MLSRFKARGIKREHIRLIHQNNHMSDADQMQQHGMATSLLLRAFRCVDNEDGGFSIRRAGDHIAQKLPVAGRVHNDEIAPLKLERNAR